MSWADATLVAGYALTTVSLLLNVTLNDGDEVRAVGRVVNALVGPLTRPLRGPRRCDRHRRRCTCRDVRRSWRRRETRAERCRRLDHRRAWDGMFESCSRCRVSARPVVELPDARLEPSVGPVTTSGVSSSWLNPVRLLEEPLRSRVRAELERDAARLVRDWERAWGTESGSGPSILGRRHRWLD